MEKKIMSEKPPQFTVTDRRKFTSEGEVREGFVPPPEESAPVATIPAAPTTPAAAASTVPAAAGPRLVTSPTAPAPEVHAQPEEDDVHEGTVPPPTVEEAAQTHAAYKESAKHLDDMLRAANPGMPANEEVSFEALVQSLYMSAMVQLGAAAQPGEKPRIDIVGARQNIDILGMLMEKTKGNLSTREFRLIDTALFDLRMMFLDITTAIAKQAASQPLPPPPGAKR